MHDADVVYISLSDFSIDSATSLVSSVYHSALQRLGFGDLQVVGTNLIVMATFLL